jgi:hypothetical protein
MGTPSDHYGLEGVGALASAYGGNDGPVRFEGNGESRNKHFNAGSMGSAQNQRRPQQPQHPPAGSATPSRLGAYALGAAIKIGK